ncbi:MAG: AAA family ATPase [Proteobacteria bacterium]|nr:AAA family ATPase [Pseudomonadota bacterium]
MSDQTDLPPPIIALCGKGGVGKTSLSALLTTILAADPKRRVLAVDADPAAGLAAALGLEVARTVDDVRNELIGRLRQGIREEGRDMQALADYRLFEALEERDNIALLAIGRPESEGCYCRVNDFLKVLVGELAAGFDAVVIDGEAGIEQVNRRVMTGVSHLVLVTDPSERGRRVAESIADVAERAGMRARIGLLVNRVREEGEVRRIQAATRLPVIGYVPEDEAVYRSAREGLDMTGLTDNPARFALERAASSFIGFRSAI